MPDTRPPVAISPVAAIGAAARGSTPAPGAVIGLRGAMALIVGMVIGAGIFKAPSMVAALAGTPELMFAAWLLGGVISVAGALCYAELGTAYASVGGDYHFLRRAYGRSVSFLFAWARFAVIATGSIALLGFVFGDYMNRIVPIGPPGNAWGPACYAASAIVVLSWINTRGIAAGLSAQSWLTALEVGGLLLLVGAALYLTAIGAAPPATVAVPEPVVAPTMSSFGMAMVFVLLTYGGWNEAAYLGGELRNAASNMVRALLYSLLVITALYLLVTWAYWQGLGMEGMRASGALAADLLGAAFGPPGAIVISAIIAIAALTSINGTIIVGARSSFAAGCDWPALGALGIWDYRLGTPATALRVQCGAALLLVLAGAFTGSGFAAMVEFTAPVFWLFFLLSGVSLFVLRWRDPRRARPFRVPLFPVLPLLFCLTCAAMLTSSLSYVYSQSLGRWNAAWVGVAVLAAGGCILLCMHRPVLPAPSIPTNDEGE